MKIKNIYENILSICNEQKKSIRSIERSANLSTGAISKWKKASPTTDNLQAVAKVLGVSVSKLLE